MTYYREINEDEEIESVKAREHKANNDTPPPNWRPGKSTISAIQGREAQQAEQGALSKNDMLYVSEIEPEAEGLIHRLEKIEGIQPEVWEKLSPQEREQVLVEVHREVAEAYHFPEARVEIAHDLPRGVNGLHQEGLIQINHRLLEKEDPTEGVETLLHESRHAYQEYMIRRPPEEIPQERRKEIQIWRENLEHYRDPRKYGFFEYYYQPVEVDAREFANAAIRKLRFG